MLLTKRSSWLGIGATLIVALIVFSRSGESGQLTYARGQNVVAAFDGWERHADGTVGLVFSYYNRNYEETVDIPIGPDNNVEPGGPDQGQPTHFLPARHKFVFSVTVPKDFDPKKRLVWTLSVRGKTEKANAFLLPEWEINNQVRAQNGDSPQASATGGNAAEYNEAPHIIPGPAQSITVSQSATLSASVTDDGLPKPRPRRANAAPVQLPSPLRVNWILYRGPAKASVQFTPPNSPIVDGKATTSATFNLPGEYVIRGYADDGAVTTPADIKVSVSYSTKPGLNR